jgi:hypothetical protein
VRTISRRGSIRAMDAIVYSHLLRMLQMQQFLSRSCLSREKRAWGRIRGSEDEFLSLDRTFHHICSICCMGQ